MFESIIVKDVLRIVDMDIRSKLDMYKENTAKKTEKPKPSGYDVQDMIPGTVCCNEAGAFYVIETKYPYSYFYGGSCIGSAMEINTGNLARLCSDNPSKCPTADNLLFLDTETTGLSGGAGTVAFLVGVGYFREDTYVVKQFFMRDYNEEPALLTELNKLLAEFEGLVTFNGRSFDWNLLQSRFISNRIRPVLKTPVHIDLLYPSRKIWGLILENCRLSSLEENILGEKRTDDIPGAMIPEVYFKYLQDRNASNIQKVVSHNKMDILSMVALMSRIAAMLDNPLSESNSGHEILGLGRIFEKSGENVNVMDCFEYCTRSVEDYSIKIAAARRLSWIYKRSGNYSKALELWEGMLESSGGFNLFSMIELAMYYEHKEKNIDKALDIVDKAVSIGRKTGLTDGAWFDELAKRHERLKRKSQKYKMVKA